MSDEQDLQKLMDIAKNPIKDDEFKKLPPARRFMMSDGIQAGDYPIPAMLIYDRYLKWADAYKIKPLDRVKFFKEFALYANKKITRTGNYYLLSPKGFDLSPQYVELVKTRSGITNVKEKSKTKKERKNKES